MEKIIDLMSDDLRKKYDGLKSDLEGFSETFFNSDFKQLSIEVLNELAKIEPSPILKGKNNGWAAGMVYSLMQVNTINNSNNVTIKNVSEHFSISEGTIFKRAKEIRELLNIEKTNENWILKDFNEEVIEERMEEEKIQKIGEALVEAAITSLEDDTNIVDEEKYASYINKYNSYINQHSREAIEPVTVVKIGRNDSCPCGSGKKYKKCCGR